MTAPNERAAEVLDAYLRALEAGKAPDREAFLAEHKDLAEWLRDAFEGLDFVQGAGRGLAGAPPSEAELGKALGDYRLLREVGRGGMAVVYEAEQISLGRRVALKVLPFAAVLDSKQLQRFKNEALAAAHLRHPNIVPVHAVGSERGVHYYAMQFIDGQSLAQAIRGLKGGGSGEGPRSPISSHGSNRTPAYVRMAAALGVQAAEALDHAHQLGIVHRDVKPANLLVDLDGTLWVTDFGLARSRHDAGLTMTGELLGTIRYMSPEQALAKRAPIDHRTDVYSLGATLYELFTLEPAFPGDDPHIVIQEIASREPVPPRRHNPALPVDLETVLGKAMAKDPGSRYATAQELADDLKRYLAHEPVLARRPSLVERAAKWSRRHRAGVAAALVMLLVGAAALTVGAKREEANTRKALQREGEARERADHALAKAEENLEVAYGAVQQFLAFSSVRTLDLQPTLTPELRALLNRALDFYDRYLSEREDAEGHIDRCRVLVALGRPEEGLAAADRAIEIQPNLPAAHAVRGVALRRLKRTEEAVRAYDRAIEIDPTRSEIFVERGVAFNELGRPEDALKDWDHAIEMNPNEAHALSNRGQYLDALRRHAEALACLDRAVQAAPRFALAHTNRSVALLHLGRLPEALEEIDLAIALNPEEPRAHMQRSKVLEALGRVAEALLACERAIALDPTLGLAHYDRGVFLMALGKDGALAAFDRAVELEPTYAPGHLNRGKLLRDMGRSQESLAASERALALDPRLVLARYNRGLVLEDLGRFPEALEEYDRAVAIDATQADLHIRRGAVLYAMKRIEEALAAWDRALELGPNEAFQRNATLLNAVAWRRAMSKDPAVRDPKRAIALAKRAAELMPAEAGVWNTLGIALCQAEEWTEALAALEKAMALRNGGDAYDWFFVAIAQAHLGRRDEARRWYEKAAAWADANAKDDADLARIRADAAKGVGDQ